MSKRFMAVLITTIIAAIFSSIIYEQKQLARPVVLQVAIEESFPKIEITYVVNTGSETYVDGIEFGDSDFFFAEAPMFYNNARKDSVHSIRRYYEVRSASVRLDEWQWLALQERLHLGDQAEVYFDGYSPIAVSDPIEWHGTVVQQNSRSIIKTFDERESVKGRTTFKVTEDVTIEDITIEHKIADTTLLHNEQAITFPLSLKAEETFTIDFDNLYAYGNSSPIRVTIKLVNAQGESLVIYENIDSYVWMTDELLKDFLEEAGA